MQCGEARPTCATPDFACSLIEAPLAREALNTAVGNNRTSKRYTLLAERLYYGFER